jgi:hypothetical protein
MDDLELLRRLPGTVDPPEAETKQRMRAVVEARSVSVGMRRRRHAVKLSVLAAAVAVAAGGTATIFHWSSDQPVAFPIEDPGRNWGFEISDPNVGIRTSTDLEAAVAEFAPAIRLPDGGSFDEWVQHIEKKLGTDDPGVYMRGDTVVFMVHVSECQWMQQWLDASARGDEAVADQAVSVLDGANSWMHATGNYVDNGHMADLLDRMRQGDATASRDAQLFEDESCAYTGSWGATPAQQDAKATGDLASAIKIAQSYLRDGGDADSFELSTADHLAPTINWTSTHVQPTPAWPGAIFIALSPSGVVSLVSVSETGTQFCAAVSHTSVVRGTTSNDLSVVDTGDGPHAVDPHPITCTSGGW